MSDTAPFNCYDLDKDYRTLKIFWFDEKTRRVDMVTAHTASKTADRRARYDTLTKNMAKAGLTPPPYA